MRRTAAVILLTLLSALVPVLYAVAQGAKAYVAVITMESGGQVTLEVWPDVAPNHVKNFLELAGKGFYDGQRVHRVEPKFVVQFGDPLSKTTSMDDPQMGRGGSGKTIKAEFNKKPFDRGVLGMARTNDPDSASSQVYIMLGDSHFLNGQYTAFGRVTKGMDVVDKIKVGDRIKSVRSTPTDFPVAETLLAPPRVATMPGGIPPPPIPPSPGFPQTPQPVPAAPPIARITPAPPATSPAAASDFGAYHALVIGNQEYRSLPRLGTPAADARAVAAVLKNDYKFTDVLIVIDATRSQIVRALDDLRKKLTQTDNLLIYYAGHGWLDLEADRGYWLPVDAERDTRSNWLSNADISDTLRALKAKHVLVVADSCYSGSLIRSIGIRSLDHVDLVQLARKKARTVLTSGGQEPVSDVGGGGHSVFARAFLDALRENSGAADMTSLFSGLRRRVLLGSDQTPQYSDIRQTGHDGGDFIFVRR